jgi:thiol-disulfide isomerase/thioredoxin
MKRMQTATLVLAVMIGAALAAGGRASRAATPATPGATAPKTFVDTSTLKPAADFKLVDLEGKARTMDEFRGKVMILDFWATWCGPCRLEIPHLKDLYTTYRDKGFEIVGVSLDQAGPNVVKDFVKKQAINYPILMGNNDVVSAYGGVRGIPTAFVITQDGKIYRRYIGYKEKSVFESDIRALLGLGPDAGKGAEKTGR